MDSEHVEQLAYDLGVKVSKTIQDSLDTPVTLEQLEHYRDICEHHAHDDNTRNTIAYWRGILEALEGVYYGTHRTDDTVQHTARTD